MEVDGGRAADVDGDEQLNQWDRVTDELGFGMWTLLMVAPFVSWGFVLPYFSLGSVFLNPDVDHWCTSGGIYANLTALPSNISTASNSSSDKYVCEEFGTGSLSEQHEGVLDSGAATLNLSSVNQSNVVESSCSAWQYDRSVFASTVTMEWDLVCDSASLSPLFQSCYYFGVAFGEPFLGFLSDRFGRRWILRRIYPVFLLAAVTATLAPNYYLILSMRFVLGIVHAISSVAFVLMLETSPAKYRSTVSLPMICSFSLSAAFFGVFAYFIRDWRLLQGVCIVPAVFHLFYLPFLDESPRWLIQNNRTEEALDTIRKVAKWHRVKVQLPNFEKKTCPVQQQTHDRRRGQRTGKSTWEVFRSGVRQSLADTLLLVQTPVMRRISLPMFCCWTMVGLAFWGMSLAAGTRTFSSDPFLYMILQSLVEAPGYCWSLLFFSKFGRRTVLALCFFGCALCMFVILAIPDDQYWLVFTLAIIGKLLITASYSLLYLYAAELFPTCIRSRGFNVSSMMARIASISSPFIVFLATRSYQWVPTLVFGSAATLGTLMSLLLPESKGMPLVNTVQETEQLYGGMTLNNKALPGGTPREQS